MNNTLQEGPKNAPRNTTDNADKITQSRSNYNILYSDSKKSVIYAKIDAFTPECYNFARSLLFTTESKAMA